MFNIRLKKSREDNNYSQIQIAEMLSITRQAYNHYETGNRFPSPDTLVKISDILNVSVDYLLGRTDDPKPNPLDKKLEGIDFALWGEVKDLSDEQKQDVIDFVEFIKSKGKK